MITTHRFILVLVGAVSASSPMAIGGCTVRAQGEPVGYAEVNSAPVDIETRHRATYEGRPVYFYRDHWYYRDGSRWNYYRQEPPALYRQRPYVQEAPPARRHYRVESPPASAPPAVQVR